MSIDAISDFDEINSPNFLNFSFIGNCNGRGVEVLNNSQTFSFVRFETRQKENFSLCNREIKPMMAKISVKHKTKRGEETEVSVAIDTRKPEQSNKPEKPKSL